MARPSPQVLCSFTDSASHRVTEVLAADAIYAVTFAGQPINVRHKHALLDLMPKYRPVAFPNAGHAHNLADKLNTMFKTRGFAVHRKCQGELFPERAGKRKRRVGG